MTPDSPNLRRVRLGRWAALLFTSLAAACEPGGKLTSPPLGEAQTAEAAPATISPVTPPSERAQAAARLLTRASFGPSDASLQEVLDYPDHGAWIDAQMALPASLQLPYTEANSNGSNGTARHEIWWQNAIEGDDQLRQRVAFALSEIFVVSDLDYTLSNAQYGMASYYDMLATHAFGSYRNLLERVTLHPVMGVYLSMVRNEKADPSRNIRPDENYAREVLQLFSIGLHELDAGGRPVPADNPTPAYTQRTVEEYARVFTGWNFANTDKWQSIDMTPFDKITPMVPVPEYHDDGAKILLGGITSPAGISMREDLEIALDSIANHPNVGPFMARRLIERLVTSNPSAEYVQRIAAVFNDDGIGVRGNLGAVIKALLLDMEAQDDGNNAPTFGKLDEPVIRLTHLMRALNATPGANSGGVYNGATRTADRVDEVYGQGVMRSPSVFNFFQPDARAGTTNATDDGRPLVAPERQILTESVIASINNDLHRLVYDHHSRAGASGTAVVLDIEKPLKLFKKGPEPWIDWLELVALGGQMSTALRNTLLEHIEQGSMADDASTPVATLDDEGALSLVLDTLYLTLASPDHMVQ